MDDNHKGAIRVRTLAMLSLVVLAGCGINTSPGNGEKIGQVVKLSKQGMICKTWEGQLIRGGMTSGSGAFGTVPFDFTVEDEALAREVEQYMRTQTEVTITYEMEGAYKLCRTDSGGHFLKSIRPATQTNGGTDG